MQDKNEKPEGCYKDLGAGLSQGKVEIDEFKDSYQQVLK